MMTLIKLRKALFVLTFLVMLSLALLSILPEAALAGTPVEYIYFPLISRLKGGQGTVPGL